jgi:uncharacterized protein DUF3489
MGTRPARIAIRAFLSDSAGLAGANVTEMSMPKISKKAAPKRRTNASAAQQQGSKSNSSGPASQPLSKHNQILNLLRRKQSASLEEMQTAAGWQPHSVRGFLSGTVKKRLGLKLQSSKAKDGERRYAIAG